MHRRHILSTRATVVVFTIQRGHNNYGVNRRTKRIYNTSLLGDPYAKAFRRFLTTESLVEEGMKKNQKRGEGAMQRVWRGNFRSKAGHS